MGFLKRLFGKKPEEPAFPPSLEVSPIGTQYQVPIIEQRPFDYIQEALLRFEEGDLSTAEKLFLEGIEQSRNSPYPFDYTYALGRYGYFLSEIGRKADAVRILEHAIDLKSDIPASYYDLMEIYAERDSENDLFRVADLYVERVPKRADSVASSLIATSSRKYQEGNPGLAEKWLLRTEGWAQKHQLADERFNVWGERGHLAEKLGDLDKAELLYKNAIYAGSRDRKTYTRLLMLLERKKEYIEALEIAQLALGVQDNATWEEDLRKRMARLEGKALPKEKRSKATIPAVSVREGVHRVDLVNQIEVTYGARDIALSIDGQSLVVSKGTSTKDNLVCLDLESGDELWGSLFPKPSMPVHTLPDGGYLSLLETGKIGEGATDLYRIDAGRVTTQTRLADKITEVRIAKDGMAIGCRDGHLYMFDLQLQPKWRHRVAHIDIPFPEPYNKPSPYFLDISEEGTTVAYSSWDTVTFVNSRGKADWTWKADQNTQSYTFSVPLDRYATSDKYYRVLGLKAHATDEDVRKAFRKRAMDTHPDRHPDNPNASDQFREAVQAFEAITSGAASSRSGAFGMTIEVRLEASMGGSSVYGVVMSADGQSLVTATSDGSISVIDRKGHVLTRLVAGSGAGSLAANRDLSRIVYSHWEGINFYSRSGLTNTHDTNTLTDLLISPGERFVAAWHDKELRLFDITGKSISRIEFARRITALVFRGDDEIIVASGKIVRLKII